MSVGSAELLSAHQTSEPLRQVMYGLLVPRRQVVEMDRVGLNLNNICVQPVVTATIKDLPLVLLPKVIQFPHQMNHLPHCNAECLRAISEGVLNFVSLVFLQAEHSQRLQVLLEALKVNEASLSCLRPELRLPVAVTCYWWQNARPTPDVPLLKALLLGLSVGASQSPEAGMIQDRFDCFFLLN